MLRALFVHDTWYARAPGGHVYAYGAFAYALWRDRFLPHFDALKIIGREAAYDEAAQNLDRADGEKVSFTLLPNINAPLTRVLKARDIYKRIAEAVAGVDAVIVRGPAEFGMMAAKAARRAGKPVAIEMSGCAFDHSWYHGSATGRLYATFKYLRCRHMVKHADQVIYVTRDFLQRRYPTRGYAETASNVDIEPPDTAVLEQCLSRIEQPGSRLVLGMIGNIGNRLKGFDILLKALAEVKDQLPPFELRVLGQGYWQDWQAHIHAYGLSNHVILDGMRPGGDPVMAWLDDIDIYLQPSFHEGLPRSVIEAMSRGLPVLASDAGGTAELLDEQYIHRRGDARALADALKALADSPARQKQAARANFERAGHYTRARLSSVRDRFWARFADLARHRAQSQQER